jgi:predicted nucleic acid-binding protein
MIFIDTSAFLAIENREDSYHESALRFRDACLKSRQLFITSDYVLDESYTIIRLRAGHEIAVQFGEALRSSRFIHIEHVTPEIIEDAWKIFKTYGDHDFSFTDCTSFVLMEYLKINTAFAFDAHFREYGKFTVSP